MPCPKLVEADIIVATDGDWIRQHVAQSEVRPKSSADDVIGTQADELFKNLLVAPPYTLTFSPLKFWYFVSAGPYLILANAGTDSVCRRLIRQQRTNVATVSVGWVSANLELSACSSGQRA
jgi:hypothetical protein